MGIIGGGFDREKIKLFEIGPYEITSRTLLAPMAGITDKPFRAICKKQGAGLTTSEMVTSDLDLINSKKTKLRLSFSEFDSPRSVQIVGSDPKKLAEAAKFNVRNGAQIIDINMGCPAKKVCNVASGSALLKNEKLVANILATVVNSVDVPVTLKTRTGWSKQNRNGLAIAKIAENEGVAALAVHGRTKECAFTGNAEYETIAKIKEQTSIPIFVNGDITSPEKAKQVLDFTNADAVMIGRAAFGNPWIFREINHYLRTGDFLQKPDLFERQKCLVEHITKLHKLYGEFRGLRIARKHINWYCSAIEGYTSVRKVINGTESANEQLARINHFFHQSIMEGETAA